MANGKVKGKTNIRKKPGYARADHLQNCAIHISKLGEKNNDGFAKISRKLSKLCRQVMDTDMVTMEPEKKRNFCRKCREVLVGQINKATVKMKDKNTVTQTCGNCGFSRNFMTLKGYGAELKKMYNVE